MTPANRGALKGIRVLDMSRILAGPFCSMMLGDLGAEVIKVENAVGGDDTRTWGPPFTKNGDVSAYFMCVNRNKKSLALNLKNPKGVEVIKKLAAESDVVLENFPPGKAAKLGVGYEQLAQVNPSLVYASLSGYGASGPKRDALAYDVIIAAIGGMLSITGPSDGPPCKPGVALTDICTGLQCQASILAALLHRERSPSKEGQWVETSLLDTQVAVLANVASNYLIAGMNPKRWGTAHSSIVPYQAFATQDPERYAIIGALNNAQFFRLAKDVLGDAAMHDNPLYQTNPERVQNREKLLEEISAHTKKMSVESIVAKCEKSKVPSAPINSMAEVFNDPQVLHRKMVRTVDHPTAGKVNLVGPAVRFSRTPAEVFAPPPLLGQHTCEILRDVAGLGEAEIAALIADKAVTQHDAIL